MLDDSLWSTYTKAVVDLYPPARTAIRIYPADPDVLGDWPPGLQPPVYVLTAWNPGTLRPGEAVNHARQSELLSILESWALELWPAVGRDLDTSHYEESAAVSGVPEADALELGARFGQDAIFCWTRTSWSVVSCSGNRRHDAGWRTETI